MAEFEQELTDLLQSELGAKPAMARQIARQAKRLKQDKNSEITAEGFVERMEKRVYKTPKANWNNVVGFLDGCSYNIGDGDNNDSEYKI